LSSLIVTILTVDAARAVTVAVVAVAVGRPVGRARAAIDAIGFAGVRSGNSIKMK
jgi:hypothetical protein